MLFLEGKVKVLTTVLFIYLCETVYSFIAHCCCLTLQVTAPHSFFLTAPIPSGMREQIERKKKKQKLVG